MFLDFPVHKFGVGFDSFEESRRELLDNIRKAQSSFPPYNIKKIEDNKYVVEIAAAGYTMSEFDIELDKDVLRIHCVPDVKEKFEYIHRGLTNKSWTREFILNKGVEVKDAKLINGLLVINLEHKIPEEMKPKKIKIDTRQMLTE